MLGYIDSDRETYYTRVINGRIYSRRRLENNIDTRNVKVKGTVLNRSEAPWRYTFEIRLGGEGRSRPTRWAGTPARPASKQATAAWALS